MEDKDKKQGLYLLLVATAIIIPLIIGLSYAYFVANISGSSSTIGGTAVNGMSFSLEMENDAYISASEVVPIDDIDADEEAEMGSFTITAGANPYPIQYDVELTNITMDNALKTADFKWKLTCVTNNLKYDVASGSFENYSSGDLTLISGLYIKPNSAENYELRIWITDTNSNQLSILNKTFSAKVKAVGEFADAILPSTYQEVEYIASTGTQHIRTGISTSTTGKSIQYAEMQISKLSQRQLTGHNYFFFGISASNYYEGAGLITTTVEPSENSFDDLRFIIDCSNNIEALIINGNEFRSSYSINTNNLDHEIMIFNIINGQSATSMTAKLKKLKIIIDDELKRDYIPCYRKNDSVAGLYDFVSNTFFTNNGTGSFSVGNDVS